MDPKWVTDLRDQCGRARVPFFFKQWGGTNKKKAGRLLDGRTWDEMPPERDRSCPWLGSSTTWAIVKPPKIAVACAPG
jgi:hypothetical protein